MFYERLEVIKDITDFKIERFKFSIMDNFKIVVDEYTIETKKSTRCKKYTICKRYSRLGIGIRNYRSDQLLSREEVPLTKEIEKQVIDIIVKKLKVE